MRLLKLQKFGGACFHQGHHRLNQFSTWRFPDSSARHHASIWLARAGRSRRIVFSSCTKRTKPHKRSCFRPKPIWLKSNKPPSSSPTSASDPTLRNDNSWTSQLAKSDIQEIKDKTRIFMWVISFSYLLFNWVIFRTTVPRRHFTSAIRTSASTSISMPSSSTDVAWRSDSSSRNALRWSRSRRRRSRAWRTRTASICASPAAPRSHSSIDSAHRRSAHDICMSRETHSMPARPNGERSRFIYVSNKRRLSRLAIRN